MKKFSPFEELPIPEGYTVNELDRLGNIAMDTYHTNPGPTDRDIENHWVWQEVAKAFILAMQQKNVNNLFELQVPEK